MTLYQNNAQSFRRFNLTELGLYYSFNMEDLSDEMREKLSDYVDDFEGRVALSAWDLQEAGVDPYDLPDYDCWREDYETAEDLTGFIKEAPHYLIFLSGYRWNGTSGYILANSLERLLYRGYDFSLYPVAASAGGKVLVCKESSHDVPMGSTTVCIALTEAEYNRLSDRTFQEVERFAMRYADQATKPEREVAA